MKLETIAGGLGLGWALDMAFTLTVILAQVEVPGQAAPSWLQLVVQTGSFGLIAYLIVVGVPKFRKEMADESAKERGEYLRSRESELADRKQERQDFAAAILRVTEFAAQQMDSMRAAARAELEAGRATAKAETDALREAFAQEQRESREFYAREFGELRRLHAEALAQFRTMVHDVRDTAQRTVNKADLAIATVQQGGKP